MEGTGKMLTLAVGTNSRVGQIFSLLYATEDDILDPIAPDYAEIAAEYGSVIHKSIDPPIEQEHDVEKVYGACDEVGKARASSPPISPNLPSDLECQAKEKSLLREKLKLHNKISYEQVGERG